MRRVILLTRFCKPQTQILSGLAVPQFPQWHDASARETIELMQVDWTPDFISPDPWPCNNPDLIPAKQKRSEQFVVSLKTFSSVLFQNIIYTSPDFLSFDCLSLYDFAIF